MKRAGRQTQTWGRLTTSRLEHYLEETLLHQASALMRSVVSHPMNRGRELIAIKRLLSWQLRSRISSPTQTDFVDGTKLKIWRGGSGATSNVYYGLAEWRDMAFLLHLLRPNDLFVDVGANIGSYSILAAGVNGATAISFEPVSETRDRLNENLRINSLLDRVEVHAVGLGSRESQSRFTSHLDAMNRMLEEEEVDANAEIVSVRRLDDVLDGRVPSLIKIDVEGRELTVLAGAARTLVEPDLQAVIVELHPKTRYEIFELAVASGLQAVDYDPFARRLLPLKEEAQNALFVRDAARVEQVLQSARTFRTLARTI